MQSARIFALCVIGILLIIYFHGDRIGLFAKEGSETISASEVKEFEDWYEGNLPVNFSALPVQPQQKTDQVGFIQSLQDGFNKLFS